MKLGKMHEAKVLGEAGSNGGGTTGTADFPYAKVYIGSSNGNNNDNYDNNDTNDSNNNNDTWNWGWSWNWDWNNGGNTDNDYTNTNDNNSNNSQSCPTSITNQGYKCCSDNCKVVYTDSNGDWGVENDDWCGCGNKSSTSNDCSSKITSKGYKCCPTNCIVYYTDNDGEWGINNGEWCGCGGSSNDKDTDGNTENYNENNSSNNIKSDYCSTAKHSGQSVTEYSNKVGNIGNVGYELWADSGNNSATFYSDGSFSCTFQNAKDYLCRSGLSFDSTKTHDQLGHMYADFKLVKQNIQNVDYSYVGIYGWSRSPLVEYYIVDNWLSQWRPGDWVGNKKHGDFTIDGATYTVYENDRYGPSIDGDTQFKQFFSIRQNPRDCGTIDITAHFQQWEKLGMKLGKMHEAKVLGEAGSNGSGTSGTADFPYAKVYIGSGNSDNTSGNTSGNTSSNTSSYPKGSGLKFYTQCNNPKHWAMTYDDGPTEFADAILDLLKEKNMKATFFVLGQMYMDANSSEWKRIVKRMDSEGHIVGTHTYTHPDLTGLSRQQIIDEMNKITNAVYSAIGKKPAFMRPPYGSGSGNQTVMGALQEVGYVAAINWNVDPMDYSNGGDINYAKQVINQARGRPIITLNHLKYGGASQSGILALANAEIELMLANGYTPVTMEECLGISAYQ
jgi:peptidoglycan/xylan/chitin deacetylase (PgdA/CDA1 family)